jgi:NAD(P)-dependent dehydrogenase (short-subunit alcohol dehydrogenase family)
MPQRNWPITGLSRGFGRIMIEQLLARGDRVAGTVRNLWVVDDLKATYGDRLSLVKLDLSEIEKGLATDPAWRCSASTSAAHRKKTHHLQGETRA